MTDRVRAALIDKANELYAHHREEETVAKLIFYGTSFVAIRRGHGPNPYWIIGTAAEVRWALEERRPWAPDLRDATEQRAANLEVDE